ncbi:unnamed protein product [Phytomonas sp. Hart1]|nr:unnamed protein product [Phytomonas sp. Hart1]|eukprot:CCW67445.1 unnamed protein product [Phytomonas sp. isolate Hart1]
MRTNAKDLSEARQRNRAAVARLFVSTSYHPRSSSAPGPPTSSAAAPNSRGGPSRDGRQGHRLTANPNSNPAGSRDPRPAWDCRGLHKSHPPPHNADPHRSCLAMQRLKRSHGLSRQEAPGEGPSAASLAWIRRHERSIPRRRAVDRYVDLTSAQVGTSLLLPNDYTAMRLAERFAGRWALDNPHHQELLRGEPVMTRIMQGEYYAPTRGGRGRQNDRRICQSMGRRRRL